LHVETARRGILLHASKRRRQRRADRGAGREDEINRDRFAFDQIGIEVELFSVLVEHRRVRNLH
jgi:hypothetical protein